MRRFLAATILDGIFASAPALANDLDGWCILDDGEYGFPLPIKNGRYSGPADTECTMTNPVPIRGMAATLYDTFCTYFGKEESPFRELSVRTDDGVLLIRSNGPEEPGAVIELVRCDTQPSVKP